MRLWSVKREFDSLLPLGAKRQEGGQKIFQRFALLPLLVFEMKVEVLEAGREDFEKIAEIYSSEFSKPPYDEPWTVEKAVNKIENFSKYCDIWKAVVEGEIVGFIIVNPNYWCPGEIVFGEEAAVKSDVQSKGVGTEMFERIFEIYKEKGYKLLMGMASRKSRALDLYKRIGFKEREDNVIIQRRLE